jgi:hypothetical protein
MPFDPTQYGPDVARILALDGNGQRLMPLRCSNCSSAEARQILKTFKPQALFPNQDEPEVPTAALWLYFSCFEEAHNLVQECNSKEAELWHAILHRQEPDSGNAAYWFRKAGQHPTFTEIAHAAIRILHRIPDAEFRIGHWDPFAFIAFCDRAREQPSSSQMEAAMEIQRAEWQILFDYCARLSS